MVATSTVAILRGLPPLHRAVAAPRRAPLGSGASLATTVDLVRLPKVVLHDHLDGGVRPTTVAALATASGYRSLPVTDPAELGRWFHQAGAESLEAYLEAFAHTYGVMQTPASMHRAAYEAVEDMAAAGVVYAEIRFAPSLHIAGGMNRDEVIAAVLSGLGAGERDFDLPTRIIIDALRQSDDSLQVAEAATRFVGAGVVGFDLAGPEAGFRASSHRAAIELAQGAGLRITLHAGEGDGVGSIADALVCGAERLGHGVRIIEDCTVAGGRIVGMGPVATEVHERRIPLEVAVVSNLDTAMYSSPAEHPVGMLHRAGFVVTLSTDNRLMSATSMVREFEVVTEYCGLDLSDLEVITHNAVEAAFCDPDTRARVVARVVAGY